MNWKWIQDVFCKMGDGQVNGFAVEEEEKRGIKDDSEDFSLGVDGL